jgi:uncharacterized protein
MRIEHTRIVITGAASGIGYALMLRLAQYPAHIVVVDRDEIRLRLALSELKTKTAKTAVSPYVNDVATQAGVDGIFEHALNTMGGIDLFIANAGFAYYENLSVANWDRLERLTSVNALAPIYSAIRMRQLNRVRPYKVVITASAMSLLPLPGYALYGATKATLHHFVQAYRYELDDPRSVMMVYPIGTRTAFFDTSGAPTTWPTQTADYVAGRIIHGIEHDKLTIQPSPTFQLLMLMGRVCPPVLRLWQAIELRRFKQWRDAQYERSGL